MTIERKIIITLDNIQPDGAISVKETTVLVENDTVIATEGNHRKVIKPGDDINDLPETAQAACRAVWSPETVATWTAKQVAALDADTALKAAANERRLKELASAETIEELSNSFQTALKEIEKRVQEAKDQGVADGVLIRKEMQAEIDALKASA